MTIQPKAGQRYVRGEWSWEIDDSDCNPGEWNLNLCRHGKIKCEIGHVTTTVVLVLVDDWHLAPAPTHQAATPLVVPVSTFPTPEFAASGPYDASQERYTSTLGKDAPTPQGEAAEEECHEACFHCGGSGQHCYDDGERDCHRCNGTGNENPDSAEYRSLKAKSQGKDAPPKCPKCGHAEHHAGRCFNMASDNDCDCQHGECQPAPTKAPVPMRPKSTIPGSFSNPNYGHAEESQLAQQEIPMTTRADAVRSAKAYRPGEGFICRNCVRWVDDPHKHEAISTPGEEVYDCEMWKGGDPLPYSSQPAQAAGEGTDGESNLDKIWLLCQEHGLDISDQNDPRLAVDQMTDFIREKCEGAKDATDMHEILDSQGVTRGNLGVFTLYERYTSCEVGKDTELAKVKSESAKLREYLSHVVYAAGGSASVQCSMEFWSHVAEEVRGLKTGRDALRKQSDAALAEIDRLTKERDEYQNDAAANRYPAQAALQFREFADEFVVGGHNNFTDALRTLRDNFARKDAELAALRDRLSAPPLVERLRKALGPVRFVSDTPKGTILLVFDLQWQVDECLDALKDAREPVPPQAVTSKIIQRLKDFTAKLESGEPIEATQVRCIETPDGPAHIRAPVLLVSAETDPLTAEILEVMAQAKEYAVVQQNYPLAVSIRGTMDKLKSIQESVEQLNRGEGIPLRDIYQRAAPPQAEPTPVEEPTRATLLHDLALLLDSEIEPCGDDFQTKEGWQVYTTLADLQHRLGAAEPTAEGVTAEELTAMFAAMGVSGVLMSHDTIRPSEFAATVAALLNARLPQRSATSSARLTVEEVADVLRAHHEDLAARPKLSIRAIHERATERLNVLLAKGEEDAITYQKLFVDAQRVASNKAKALEATQAELNATLDGKASGEASTGEIPHKESQ